MNTDHGPDLRGGISTRLLFEAETRKIIGIAFEVLNELGHGLAEKICEHSLTVLFKLHGI
jgi:hypothetical protein